jgi:hypothetical protein
MVEAPQGGLPADTETAAADRMLRIIRISNIIHWCMLGYVVLIVYEAWLLQKVL